MKADFLATASHELRTPVAAVYGAAMTLMRTDYVLDEEARTRLLEIIASESDRLTRIVDDVLWASRVDRAALTLRTTSFDAAQLAAGSSRRARAPSSGRDASPLRPPSPAACRRRPGQVRQVLRTCSTTRSSTRLTAARSRSPRGAPGRVRFSIRDEGLGVPSPSRPGSSRSSTGSIPSSLAAWAAPASGSTSAASSCGGWAVGSGGVRRRARLQTFFFELPWQHKEPG